MIFGFPIWVLIWVAVVIVAAEVWVRKEKKRRQKQGWKYK